MKRLPTYPYLTNILAEYYREKQTCHIGSDYPRWLQQFGFVVPIYTDYLEFPDDFSEQQLMMFIIRWS
jgi:hypothetical protein